MDIKHLLYIIKIADEQNITEAAKKLYISQSSLSYYLCKLESEIGTPLFVRNKNGVVITDAGKKYVDAAKKVISIRNDLYNDITPSCRPAKITIATSALWGMKFLASIIPDFKKTNPSINFQMTQTEYPFLQHEIANGNIDFAFLSLSAYDELSNTMTNLRNEDMYFAVPITHPYTHINTTDKMSLSDIPKYFDKDNFIISRKGSSNRITAEHIFADINFSPKQITEINGLPLTCEILTNGDGVAFMPDSGTCQHKELIKYYYLTPSVFRQNILLSKPEINYSYADKLFYKFVCRNFKKNHRL